MRRLSLLFLVLAASVAAQSFNVPNVTDLQCPYAAQLARAIWTSEGGDLTAHPYGILSVPVRDTEEARLITLRSIHLNYARWIRAGKPGGPSPDAFVGYMATRWVPAVCDPSGHKNWVRNVRILLTRDLNRARLIP